MKSRAATSFWKNYKLLPKDIQKAAVKRYRLWLKDPRHSSLQFKKVERLLVCTGYRSLSSAWHNGRYTDLTDTEAEKLKSGKAEKRDQRSEIRSQNGSPSAPILRICGSVLLAEDRGFAHGVFRNQRLQVLFARCW